MKTKAEENADDMLFALKLFLEAHGKAPREHRASYIVPFNWAVRVVAKAEDQPKIAGQLSDLAEDVAAGRISEKEAIGIAMKAGSSMCEYGCGELKHPGRTCGQNINPHWRNK